jgi:autotransporter-associated beta strand protein
MASSKISRRKATRLYLDESLTDRLRPRLRLLRLENLEARRLLANGPFYQVALDLESQLTTYQNSVDGVLNGLTSLPIVGSQLGGLSSVTSAIDGAAGSIKTNLQAIQNADPAALVQKLYDAIGPGGANILAGANYNTPNSLSQSTDIHVTTPITFDSNGLPTGAVEMRLHETIVQTNVNLTTGLSTLPIQLVPNANVAISGNIDLELAVSIVDGSVSLPTVYLNDFTTGLGVNASNSSAPSQLMVSANASVSGSLTAYVGFLQGTLTAVPSQTQPSVGSQNALGASVYVSSLQSPSVTVGGSANFNLSADLSFANAPDLPGIGTTISMTWPNLFDPSSLDFQFGQLTLKLGTFLSHTIGGVLADIKQYLQPVQSVMDVLDSPVPGIDSLPGMSGTTLKDLITPFLQASGNSELASLIEFGQDIDTLLGVIPSAPAGGTINFGDFGLKGSAIAGANATLSTAVQNLKSGVPGTGALSGLTTDNLSQYLDQASSTLLSTIQGTPDWLAGNNQGLSGAAQTAADTAASFTTDVAFPVLDDPASLLGMLFGQDVNLVTFTGVFNLPVGNFNQSVFIPILGPAGITLTLAANFSLTGKIEAGYDTQGVREAFNDAAGNPGKIPSDLLDGFYIAGPNGADKGTSIIVKAGISGMAGVSLNVGFASATLGPSGGLAANLTVTMNPGIEGPDGKIRLNSLTTNIGNDFAPSGNITVSFALNLNLQFVAYSQNITLVNFAKVTLWDSSNVNANGVPGSTQPAPVLYGLSATDGPMGGGNQLTLYGMNLQGASSVTFAEDSYGTPASVSVTPFNIQPTSIEVNVPASSYTDAYHPANVDVTTPGGTSPLLLSQTYIYYPAPTFTSITPTAALAGGGTIVTIVGSGLLYSTVNIAGKPAITYPGGSNPATNAYAHTDDQISVYAPAGTGAVPVTLVSDGGASAAGSISYIPQPQVTGVSPAAGPIKVSPSAAQTVTISGQNFGYLDANGNPVSTVSGVLFGNAGIAAGSPYTAGLVPVISNTWIPGFTYQGITHAGHWALTVKPPWYGVAGYVDVLVETTPIGPPPEFAQSGQAFGNWSSPTSQANPQSFLDAYTYAARPQITSINPTSGPVKPLFGVSLYGTDFAGATAVNFGSTIITSSNFTYSDGFNGPEIDLAPPPVTTPQTVNVTVTTPGGTSDPISYSYGAVPVVSSVSANGVSPAVGPEGGGTVVTITGTGLDKVTELQFGAFTVAGVVTPGTMYPSQFISQTATQIKVKSPYVGYTGTVDVQVLTVPGDYSALSTADQFTYLDTPIVAAVQAGTSALVPNIGQYEGGTTVTITGQHLSNLVAVDFGLNNPPPTIVSQSDTQIVAVSPAIPGGVFVPNTSPDVTVTTLGGTSATSAYDKFTYSLLQPEIDSITPNFGSAGGGTIVTITGKNFVGTTEVDFRSILNPSLKFHVDSPTQITATTPASTNGTGLSEVWVKTGTGAGFQESNGNSSPEFNYLAGLSVASISPQSGAVGPGTTVTIVGADLANAIAVKFGSRAGTIVPGSNTIDGTQLQAITPTTTTADAGTTAYVSVETAAGWTPITSAAQGFTYVLPIYDVTGVSPSSGPVAGGTTVTISGDSLGTATAVDFSSAAGTVSGTIVSTSSDGKTIVVTTPASLGKNPGAVDVIVGTSAYGLTPVSPADQFTYILPGPIVTSLSPASGPGAGGTSVTITGSNLSDITLVKFGNHSATGLIYNANGSITVTNPPGTAGTEVDVTIVGAGGLTSPLVPGDQFLYDSQTPNISAVSPNFGPAGDNNVNINYTTWIFGQNLSGVYHVMFGSSLATVLQDYSTGIYVTVPAQDATGSVDVTVLTPFGLSQAAQYTYTAGPVLSGLDVQEGPVAGGTTVTISGYNLMQNIDTGATAVYFGGVPAASFTNNWGNPPTITAVSPADSAGTVGVTLTTQYGTSSAEYANSNQFTYVPVPTVSGIIPASGGLGGGNTVVINGSGLATATEVDFGSIATTNFYPVGGDLLVQVPAGLSLGSVDVKVVTVGGAVTDASAYTYMPAPIVTGLSVPSGLSPPSGALEGGTTVVITGSHLANATAVDFGPGDPATIISDTDTQIVVASPASSTGDVGSFDVTVTTPNGTTATSSADQFTYTHAPFISSVSGPNTINGNQAAGLAAGGDTVTINGDDLDSNDPNAPAVVDFGGVAATIVSHNANQIQAIDPAGTVGTVDISVTTPIGTTDISAADQFTYGQAPSVTAVSPPAGMLAGGTPVTITGTGLALATAVDFGEYLNTGTPNAGTIISATVGQIVAASPWGGNGSNTVDVTVVTPFGRSTTSLADQFSFVAPPSIFSLDTYSGPVYGGTTVTITGTDLANATSVSFGVNPGTIQSDSGGQIVVLSPESTGDVAGAVDLTVTTAYGMSTGYQFNYVPPPSISAIDHSVGPVAGGTTVTIFGTNLLGATGVEFGGVAAASLTDNGDGTLTVVSPAGNVSTVDITVVTAGGTSLTAPADQFTYVAAPSIVSINPAAGPLSGGTLVTIIGAAFTGALAVDFNGVAASSFAVVSDGTLSAVSPDLGSAGAVDVTVVTTGGTSATSQADQFTYIAAPTVTGLSLSTGNRDGGDQVAIYGTNLDSATEVAFGPNAAAILDVSSTQIDVLSAPGVAGTVDVTVVAPGGISATGSQDQFTYIQPVPAVTGLSQSVGPAGGGETVTITGTDLDAATAVDFGGVAGSIVAGSDTRTQVTVTVPAGTLGTVDVTVTTSGGTSDVSPADQFTGVPVPVVSSTESAIGPTAGGTDVIIYGSYLDGATAVNFGQTAGTIVADASNYILATSPAGSAGSVHMTVTTPYGTSATSSADTFTYVAAPTAVPDSYTVIQDATLTLPAPGVLANDTAPQGYALTATLLTEPANGILSLDSDGSFTYTPNSGYLGPDSFTYMATNGYANSAAATVSITVSPAALTWTGSTGNWTDGTWGVGSSYPGSADNAVVGSGGVVNVTSDEQAFALAIQSGGQVAVGPGTVLSVAADTSVTGGSELDVDPNGAFFTGGTFTLDSGGSAVGGPITAAAYQLNDGTASANLSGPGGVTKDTGGTVILSGSNSYTGGTAVTAGTLIVESANALPEGSSLTVGAGAASMFGAVQAAASISIVGSATPAPAVASASDTSAPVVAARPIANTSVTAFVIPTVSPVAQGQVAHLSYGPRTQSESPAAILRATVDAVFASHPSAFDRTGAPRDNAQSAQPLAWFAASESYWNYGDQGKTNGLTVEALDKVLARFGV